MSGFNICKILVLQGKEQIPDISGKVGNLIPLMSGTFRLSCDPEPVITGQQDDCLARCPIETL